MSKIASNFYIRQPKKISAVTGTNGKTSVTFITKEIWRNCNVKSASIGTLGLIADEYNEKHLFADMRPYWCRRHQSFHTGHWNKHNQDRGDTTWNLKN